MYVCPYVRTYVGVIDPRQVAQLGCRGNDPKICVPRASYY
jgi:hypothetical protein